ncbi:MAG: class I SAM-dependent methyltransferase [Chloroflexi bacterium]|nr:class I SAM-dependent methyltransferase [Chloroflexota bacterium]MBU1661410.1 class I SAM-dependent methyltransferase [Chloroflexota bacterium]
MAMTKLEKRFVNRQEKGRRNIKKVRQGLAQLDVNRIRDVLELGCGIGSVSAFFAENYAVNVFGIDFDPGQVKIARQMHPENNHLSFRVGDASNLDFEDESFDLVLSQDVFHHVPAWDAAVQEVARVLRPHGYFIWLDFTYPRIIKQVFRSFVKSYGLYTWDDIRLEFNRHGLEQHFYEQLTNGIFSYHHVVLQKR